MTYRIQKQKFRHVPDALIAGDCHRTSIACCLNLPRDEVPHYFGDFFFIMKPEEAWLKARQSWREWLQVRGVDFYDFALSEELTVEEVVELSKTFHPTAHMILSGQSANETNHSVVISGGKIVCDPAIDNSGIKGPMLVDGKPVGYAITIFISMLTVD